MEICVFGKTYSIKKSHLFLLVAFVLIYIIIGNPFSTPESDKEQVEEQIVTETFVPQKEEKELIHVYVSGRVKKPGVYEVAQGEIISEILKLAGGVKKGVKLNLNLAYKINSNVQICIGTKKSYINDGVTRKSGNNSTSTKSNGKINLNTASAEELMTIGGIGEATAKKIIDYRTKSPFKKLEDLMNVSGIGEKKFEDMKAYVTI